MAFQQACLKSWVDQPSNLKIIFASWPLEQSTNEFQGRHLFVVQSLWFSLKLGLGSPQTSKQPSWIRTSLSAQASTRCASGRMGSGGWWSWTTNCLAASRIACFLPLRGMGTSGYPWLRRPTPSCVAATHHADRACFHARFSTVRLLIIWASRGYYAIKSGSQPDAFLALTGLTMPQTIKLRSYRPDPEDKKEPSLLCGLIFVFLYVFGRMCAFPPTTSKRFRFLGAVQRKELYRLMRECASTGGLLGCASKGKWEKGIAPLHAYTVLGLREVETVAGGKLGLSPFDTRVASFCLEGVPSVLFLGMALRDFKGTKANHSFPPHLIPKIGFRSILCDSKGSVSKLTTYLQGFPLWITERVILRSTRSMGRCWRWSTYAIPGGQALNGRASFLTEIPPGTPCMKLFGRTWTRRRPKMELGGWPLVAS